VGPDLRGTYPGGEAVAFGTPRLHQEEEELGGAALLLPRAVGTPGSSPRPPLAGELTYVDVGPLAKEHTHAGSLVGDRACAEVPCGRPPPQGAPRAHQRSGERPLAGELA
jgi:hypothetical protein